MKTNRITLLPFRWFRFAGKRLFCRVLVFAAGAVVLVASSAFAATFTVSNTNDSGPGSLRQAILDANATAGADTIAFGIAGIGVHTISPLSFLPALTDDAGVTIDGYTQPGSSRNTLAVGNDAVLAVEISGAATGDSASGIAVRSSANLIRGLVINQFDTAVRVDRGTGNTVTGCFIGTDPAGTSPRPNRNGIGVFPVGGEFESGPADTLIGGNDPSERNLISGNASTGVGVGFTSASTRILGNYIGTDASGTEALGNGQDGIVCAVSTDMTIGGTTPGSGNVISGNNGPGINIGFSFGIVVQGNLIGTNASGTAALPNTGAGISCVQSQSQITIGGAGPGARNVISGNSRNGLWVFNSSGVLAAGNLIGTNAAGTAPVPNGQNGVFILASSRNNTVGGTTAGAGNTIAFNSLAGVAIGFDGSDASIGNRINGNSIHDNEGLGIDLGSDGVTPANDCGSAAGPNLLQSVPVLTAAATSGASTRIRGTLNSTPGSSFTLEFFSNGACDPSGYGEGAGFLGSTLATTDASCNASFDVTLPVGVAPGSFITATATDAAGNTSEFSACRPASEEQPALTALSPARVWVGLKNSDDVGLRLDLKAEVFRNGSLIGSGEADGVSAGSSGFNRAVLDQVLLTLFAPVVLSPGDRLSIKLSVRAGATGRRNGTVRLWSNDSAANSRFGATIGGASVDFYLLDGFVLGTSPGPGPKRTIDVFVDRAAGGNPFKPLGTWSKTF